MTKSMAGPVERVSETHRVLHDSTQQVTVDAAGLHGGVELSCRQVLVQSHPDNTQYIYIGNNFSQSVMLAAGQSETISIDDVSKIYVRAAGGIQVVNWHALEI